jgi:tRNA(adenine34) deaminase
MDILPHEHYMKAAYREAEKAFEDEEVPVGAVVVCRGHIIAKGYNQVERLHDVTAHAEMIALTSASEYLGSKYLNQCTMYVTLEPCLMCATALKWAKLGALIYGASDRERGFVSFGQKVLHPKTEVIGGVLENECSEILKEFFRVRRS